MGNLVIAIDIGTSSAKGVAVLPDGSVLATVQRAYPLITPQLHFVEQDPELVADAVVAVLKESIDRAGIDSLAAISFSSAMHSLMAVDSAGKPLTPLITWADTRSHQEAAELREKPIAKKLGQVSGTPIHPMSPLCKLIWMKKHQPKLLRQAHKVVGIKEYVFYKLFNEWVVDYSIASATGLFDTQKLNWLPEALRLAGVEESQLSRPVPTRASFTKVQPDQVKKIGLNKVVPFIIGASDGCLANLGSGVMDKGEMAITIGTSGAVRMTLKKYAMDETGKTFCYVLDENHFVAGGATNNGAAVLGWFDNSFRPEVESIATTDATKIPAGCDGLIFLPYLMGERAPIYDPMARGVFFGIDIRHSRLHFRKAVMEGICFQIEAIVQSMKALGPIRKVIASGGFTGSKEWVQMLSDVLGKEIHVTGDSDASALGAAKLAFETLDVQRKEHGVETVTTYSPDFDHHQIYQKQFRKFSALYTRLKDQFER